MENPFQLILEAQQNYSERLADGNTDYVCGKSCFCGISNSHTRAIRAQCQVGVVIFIYYLHVIVILAHAFFNLVNLGKSMYLPALVESYLSLWIITEKCLEQLRFNFAASQFSIYKMICFTLSSTGCLKSPSFWMLNLVSKRQFV